MPQPEYVCTNSQCSSYKPVPSITAAEPLECGCGQMLEQAVYPIRTVFTGVITARYNDRTKENAHQDGHWAFRRKSSISGKPEPVFIETFDDQRSFCKAEGLANPKEMPTNYEIAADGRTVANTVGMPGCEV